MVVSVLLLTPSKSGKQRQVKSYFKLGEIFPGKGTFVLRHIMAFEVPFQTLLQVVLHSDSRIKQICT